MIGPAGLLTMTYNEETKTRHYEEIILKSCKKCDEDIPETHIYCVTCHNALEEDKRQEHLEYLRAYQKRLYESIKAYPASIRSLMSRYYGYINDNALLYIKKNHYKEYAKAMAKAVEK